MEVEMEHSLKGDPLESSDHCDGIPDVARRLEQRSRTSRTPRPGSSKRRSSSRSAGSPPGIAHEINTPIQFVGDSVEFVQHAFGRLSESSRLPSPARGGRRARSPPLVDDARRGVEASCRRRVPARARCPRAIGQTLDGLGASRASCAR